MNVNSVASLLQALNALVAPIGDGGDGQVTPQVHLHRCATGQRLPLTCQGTFTYLVLQGAVHISGAHGSSVYCAGQSFVSASIKHTPAHIVARADAGDPDHVGLRIEIPTEDVVAVMLELEVNFTTALLEQSAAASLECAAHVDLLQLLQRMLLLEAQGKGNPFLHRHLRRELAYCLITGPHGHAFVQDVLRSHNASDIYTVNDWIKRNYRSAFAVDALADQANMSLSTFHKKFKATIGMGPLQCQKQLRLAEARRLMLNQSMSVTQAALEVGYESLSQFSREYRKLFGSSAQDDIRTVRSRLADQ